LRHIFFTGICLKTEVFEQPYFYKRFFTLENIGANKKLASVSSRISSKRFPGMVKKKVLSSKYCRDITSPFPIIARGTALRNSPKGIRAIDAQIESVEKRSNGVQPGPLAALAALISAIATLVFAVLFILK
jgi:hypothetical protein